MSKTSELVQKYLDGYEIVVTCGPIYAGRKDGLWPVLYKPRHAKDPYPFEAVGTETRYTGGELRAIPTRAQVHSIKGVSECPECEMLTEVTECPDHARCPKCTVCGYCDICAA